MQYKRILLKLSGEALMGDRNYGIDPRRLELYAEEIKAVVEKGVEVAPGRAYAPDLRSGLPQPTRPL